MSYVGSPGAVVFEYTRRPAELASHDYAVLFRLYGDGRVLLQDPRLSEAPKSLVVQLSPDETRNLLVTVVERGLVEFDSTAIRSSLRDRALAGGAFVSSPDADISSFEIRLEEYRPVNGTGQSRTLTNVHKKVIWDQLQQDAESYPELRALGALSELETELLTYLAQIQAAQENSESEN